MKPVITPEATHQRESQVNRRTYQAGNAAFPGLGGGWVRTSDLSRVRRSASGCNSYGLRGNGDRTTRPASSGHERRRAGQPVDCGVPRLVASGAPGSSSHRAIRLGERASSWLCTSRSGSKASPHIMQSTAPSGTGSPQRRTMRDLILVTPLSSGQSHLGPPVDFGREPLILAAAAWRVHAWKTPSGARSSPSLA